MNDSVRINVSGSALRRMPPASLEKEYERQLLCVLDIAVPPLFSALYCSQVAVAAAAPIAIAADEPSPVPTATDADNAAAIKQQSDANTDEKKAETPENATDNKPADESTAATEEKRGRGIGRGKKASRRGRQQG